MPAMSTNMRGLRELERKLEQLPQDIRKGAETGVGEGTQELVSAMQANAPVDTGELQASIHADTSGLEGRAVADAGHAIPVEAGTSVTPAQPYAQPAVEEARQTLPQRIGDAIKNELPT